VGVTDGNKATGFAITNSNTTEALLEDLKARGYELSVNDKGNLQTNPKGPPITPVIYWALQANYGKLKQLIKPPVTDTNCRAEQTIRKDNTDWSKVADLRPKRGEEMDQALAEYREAYQAATDVVKAAGRVEFVVGMRMHWQEMDKLRSGRDREAKRRIKASKKGGACGKCGRVLGEDEAVWIKCRVYAGIAGGLMSRPGPRYEDVPQCGGCINGANKKPVEWGEYGVYGERMRLSKDGRLIERPCSTCERPVVYEVPRRGYYDRPVYCCYRCEYTYHNHKRAHRDEHLREKVCEVCGKEFTAKRAHTKTCSAACKQKAYRARRQRTSTNG
jgi:hypothetical protein